MAPHPHSYNRITYRLRHDIGGIHRSSGALSERASPAIAVSKAPRGDMRKLQSSLKQPCVRGVLGWTRRLLNNGAAYRLHLARAEEAKTFEECAMCRAFPIAELTQRGLIRPHQRERIALVSFCVFLVRGISMHSGTI